MAYETYNTRAYVCGTYDHNTSDKRFQLFTRDAGMVFVTARSVREEKSKQRMALQDFSLVAVSIIPGKGGWRVGSVSAELNVFRAARTRSVRAAALHITKLLRQYVRGEEPHPALFAEVAAICTYLAETETLDADFLDIVTFRFLAALGYVAPSPVTAYVIDTPIPDCQLDDTARAEITKQIKRATVVSHL